MKKMSSNISYWPGELQAKEWGFYTSSKLERDKIIEWSTATDKSGTGINVTLTPALMFVVLFKHLKRNTDDVRASSQKVGW